MDHGRLAPLAYPEQSNFSIMAYDREANHDVQTLALASKWAHHCIAILSHYQDKDASARSRPGTCRTDPGLDNALCFTELMSDHWISWLDETVITMTRVGIICSKKAYNELRHDRNLMFRRLLRQTVVACNATVFFAIGSLDKTYPIQLPRDYVQEAAAIYPVSHGKLTFCACRSWSRLDLLANTLEWLILLCECFIAPRRVTLCSVRISCPHLKRLRRLQH